MVAEEPRKPWYRRFRYVILLGVLLILIITSFLPSFYRPPVTTNQARLNMTVDYVAHNYNSTTGLVPEYPGSQRYRLYSDNYLVVLALSRYDPGNQSTLSFAAALNAALSGYAATFGAPQNQYEAMNSSQGYFGCSRDYSIQWANATTGPQRHLPTATILTVSNDGDPSCSSQNYSDLLFLQALHYHRLGNSSGATYFYDKGAADFDGIGVVDLVSNATLYQTFKLALYLYASSCLGQTSGAGFGTAEHALFSLQDNSTGGFYSGYTAGLSHGGTTVNTETTALAALALEQVLRPSGSC